MKPLAIRIALLTAFISLAVPLSAQEIRAFWADAFAEGIHTPEQVDTLLRRLRATHCNAVFIQVRKGGDAYYLSRYEPWAADNPQRFDGLAYLTEMAHKETPRIQVHAWINTFAVGKTHGNSYHIAAAHPDWLSLSDTGENFDGEATKVDPGNPDAADWTFRVYLDVARHYDVDGIHFDFVRYGSTDGKGRFGYNPVSVARFNARYGRTGQPAWNDPLWKQWRRDQVTALVRKVYAMATAIKPKLAVSAATVTWGDGPKDMRSWTEKSAPMNRVFQDWRAWMEEGILDINCQMSYYREAKHGDYFRHWIDWGKDHQYRRWVVPGSGIWLNPISDSLKQIEAIRKPSKKGKKGRGVLLYSYAGTNAGPDGTEQSFNEDFYTALSQPSPYGKKPPFAKPAAFPKLPWKEQPKTGIVKGFVLTADALTPVDGAKVTLAGKVKRAQFTDGTGFYAFVDVPPGDYKVRVEAKGYTPAKRETVLPLRTGDLGDMYVAGTNPSSKGGSQRPYTNFRLGPVPEGSQTSLKELSSLPLGKPVRSAELEVVAGNDVYKDWLFVIDWSGGAHATLRLVDEPLMPYQAGDILAIEGKVADSDGERVVDVSKVRLVGMVQGLPPRLTHGRGLNDGRALASVDGTVYPWVRVGGSVLEVKHDRFLLDDGVLMEVMLTGSNEPGIEAPPLALSPPRAGAHIEVGGLCTVSKQPGGKTLIRIRPRSQEDIVVLSSGLSERLKTAAQWSALPLAGILVWLVYSRAALRGGPRTKNRGRD
jgi:uncharacterized lipoprotein YddW (UPF0748 family)